MTDTLLWGTIHERPAANLARAFVCTGPAAVAGLYVSDGAAWTLAGGAGAAGLSSFLAADGSMTVGGTLTDPTVAVHPDGTGLEVGGGALRLKDGGVTSAKIADGTIVNADINAAAAIAYSKLALAGAILSTDLAAGAVTHPSILRTVSVAYAATVTPNADTTDVLNIGALTGNLTLANPTGTPVDGQNLRVRFLQDGTGGRTSTFGVNFAFGTDVTTALIPTTASAKYEMLFTWDAADSKWRATAIVRGF